MFKFFIKIKTLQFTNINYSICLMNMNVKFFILSLIIYIKKKKTSHEIQENRFKNMYCVEKNVIITGTYNI